MDEMQMIPYTIHESDMARMERQLKRLWIVLIMTIVFLVGSNAAWIYYESQFVDEVTETIETSADGGGNAYGTIVSGDNSEVNYGESQGYTDKAQD